MARSSRQQSLSRAIKRGNAVLYNNGIEIKPCYKKGSSKNAYRFALKNEVK